MNEDQDGEIIALIATLMAFLPGGFDGYPRCNLVEAKNLLQQARKLNARAVTGGSEK